MTYHIGERVRASVDIEGTIIGVPTGSDAPLLEIKSTDGSIHHVTADYVTKTGIVDLLPRQKLRDDRYAHLPSDVEPGGDAA